MVFIKKIYLSVVMMISKYCNYCNKEFYIKYKSEEKRKFCSQKCWGLFLVEIKYNHKYEGKTVSAVALCRKLKLNYTSIMGRIKRHGIGIEDAIKNFKPKKTRNKVEVIEQTCCYCKSKYRRKKYTNHKNNYCSSKCYSNSTKRLFEYNGYQYSYADIAKLIGMSESNVKHNIRKGFTVEQFILKYGVKNNGN